MVHPDPANVPRTKVTTDKREQTCIARGGTWNSATQECTLPGAEPISKREARFRRGGRPTLEEVPTGVPLTREQKERLGGAAEFQRSLGGEPSAALAIERKQRGEKEQQLIQTERERLLAEETPVRRELSPIDPSTGLPVLGGAAGVLRDFIEDVSISLGIPGVVKTIKMTPEELRTVALTKIEKDVVKEGLTSSEKFGKFVEGVPVAGALASKFAGGLIETPSSNVRAIVQEVESEKTRATNIERKVKQNLIPKETGREILNEIEENMQRLESRIKLLIVNSPILKFDSDGVNTIESKILKAKERVFFAKLEVLRGAITDPTELAIFLALNEKEGDGND